MKLVGLVFLGLIASFVFFALLLMLLTPVFDDTGETWGMLLAALVIMPFAFFSGSIITGYFSYYEIENKWMLIWMTPALYWELVAGCAAGVAFLLDAFIGVNPPGPGFLRDLLIYVALGLLWYIASAGGVFLGYYLRERFAKWRYGD